MMCYAGDMMSASGSKHMRRYIAALEKIEAEETWAEREERLLVSRLSGHCESYRKIDALLASDWQPEEKANG